MKSLKLNYTNSPERRRFVVTQQGPPKTTSSKSVVLQTQQILLFYYSFNRLNYMSKAKLLIFARVEIKQILKPTSLYLLTSHAILSKGISSTGQG